jgi:Tol biopolymer transport system component
VSDDGQLLVGSADATTDELMLISLSGGTNTTLRTSPSSVSILGPEISPNKQWVAYTEGNTGSTGFDLFVISAAGGAPRRATPPRGQITPNLHNVSTYAFSPDSRYLAAMGDYVSDGVFELSVFDTVTGAITQPITTTTAGTGQSSREFGWTNTGQLVVRAALNGNITRLHLCSVTGPCVPLPGTPTLGAVNNLSVSRDGTFAVYSSDERMALHFDLYRVATSGGVPVRISPDVPNGWRPAADSMFISPNGAWVTSLGNTGAGQGLYVFSTTGGSPLTPLWTLPSLVAVLSLTWAPNSAHLAFRSDLVTDGSYDAYRLSDLVAPSTPILVQSSQGGDVVELRWTN